MSQNDIQVGGNHYKKGGTFQHWDVIERFGHGYLEGYATKYLTRFRDKGGVLDLEKAVHCLAKLKELYNEGVRTPRGFVTDVKLLEYLHANGIKTGSWEASAISLILQWRHSGDLDAAIVSIENTIGTYKQELKLVGRNNTGL